jgi:hypothetical protein
MGGFVLGLVVVGVFQESHQSQMGEKKKGAALYNAQKVSFYSKHVLTYK